MKNKKPIYVTMPSLAPLEEYMEILKSAWASGILTHNGPLVQKLEKELKAYLKVKNLVAVTNGTIGLQLAIKALGLSGEIITTPFSWIATCSAIKWENCSPVFVDIDIETFNIDPNKVEDAITDRTTAILAVHVFSNPCDVEALSDIAEKYNLKIIYDAAHAMCVDYKGKSLLEYGDISATSFHATKLFNTGEGGACVTLNDELSEQIKRIRFFGHNDNKEIVEDGMNGKMTEIHAALGLANLKYLESVAQKRKEMYSIYRQSLSNVDYITFQKINEEAYNYSYMPVVFDTEEQLINVQKKLNEANIFPRRYFYPSLNTIKVVASYFQMPLSVSLAKRILCLPSYNSLSIEKVNEICQLINNCN